MNPRTIDLLVATFLFCTGILLSVVGLTLAAGSVIWFFDDFEGSNSDLVMEKVVLIGASALLGCIARYCIKRAVQVWQTIP